MIDYQVHCQLQHLSNGGKAWRRERTNIYREMLEKEKCVHIGSLGSFGVGPVLQDLRYAFSLVDESGQATEPSILPIASSCERLCLVGDHQQLPPHSRVQLMSRSLLERLSKQHGFEIIVLEEQYRMLPEIAAWPSKYYYGDRLRCARPAPTSAFELIPGFDWPKHSPMAFVHVDGVEKMKGTSYENQAEGKTIAGPRKTKNMFCFLFFVL